MGEVGREGEASLCQYLLANSKFSDDFNKHITAAKAKEDDEPPAEKTCSVTILPSISIMNYQAGAPPPLPVKLDGDLPHMSLLVGDSASNNLETMLMALLDTGAGATIG